MKRMVLFPLAFVLFVWTSPRAHAALQVVATVPDLAALAKAIGGDDVRVQPLSLPTQDPHFVDAKPSLALAMNRADLLLLVGLDLEVGWLPTLLTGARNGKIQSGASGYLDCSQFVTKLDVPTTVVDRSQGDIHPQGNPHYLYDPRAAAAVATGIAARLGELDPDNAAAYRKRLAAFQSALDARRAHWEKALAKKRGTAFVSYHRTFSYLADWLGWKAVGFLEPKPGVPPNPKHVAGLARSARAAGVRLVLQESYYPDAMPALVARQLEVPLVRIRPATDVSAGESYLEHFERMMRVLEAPFQS